MRLLRAEVGRSLRREVVRFLALATLAGVVVGCAIFAVTSHRPTELEWTQARETRFQATGECPDTGATCDRVSLAPWLSPDIRTFDLASAPKTIEQATVLLFIVAWLLGSTIVGGDWESGVMATQLTWEPRRSALFVAKVGSIGFVTALFAFVALGLLVLGLTAVAHARGIPDAPPGTWADVVGVWLRATALAAVGAIGAAAVAFLARSAAFAVATLMIYVVGVEIPLHVLYPGVSRWLLIDTSFAWITGSREGLDISSASGGGHLMPPVAGLALLVLVVASIALVARATFLRRDIV